MDCDYNKEELVVVNARRRVSLGWACSTFGGEGDTIDNSNEKGEDDSGDGENKGIIVVDNL